MVPTARNLHNFRSLDRVLDLRWFQDTISVCLSKPELALISVAAAKHFVFICDKDRVSTTGLQVLDLFTIEGLCWDDLWRLRILETTSVVWCNT